VLDYGRPGKGNPASVDVNAAVRRTLQVIGSSRDQETRLVLETDDTLPPVRLDEEQLRQVLINLVRNAEEAMGGAGAVTVTTRMRPAPTGAGYVAIAVHDRGPGIPQDQLAHLFVPFFTTKPRGTGLGLAISQRMVQSMGGRIEVASVVGVGSVFTILLPVFEATAPRPTSLRPGEPEPRRRGSAAPTPAGTGGQAPVRPS
jgi:signal transduction histidine kinase